MLGGNTGVAYEHATAPRETEFAEQQAQQFIHKLLGKAAATGAEWYSHEEVNAVASGEQGVL